MANLVLGPLLRYVSDTEATVWVETDAACEVEVLDERARAFEVAHHHYALVCIDGLEPGGVREYGVALDGETVWPPAGTDFPPSAIGTLEPDGKVDLVFGSCRVSLPHEPPYTLTKDENERGREVDALYVLGRQMLRGDRSDFPEAILMLWRPGLRRRGAAERPRVHRQAARRSHRGGRGPARRGGRLRGVHAPLLRSLEPARHSLAALDRVQLIGLRRPRHA